MLCGLWAGHLGKPTKNDISEKGLVRLLNLCAHLHNFSMSKLSICYHFPTVLMDSMLISDLLPNICSPSLSIPPGFTNSVNYGNSKELWFKQLIQFNLTLNIRFQENPHSLYKSIGNTIKDNAEVAGTKTVLYYLFLHHDFKRLRIQSVKTKYISIKIYSIS